MTIKKFLFLLPFIFFLILIAWGQINKNSGSVKPENSHTPLFFEEKTFYDAVSETKNLEGFGFRAAGGVVPHDLFASFIIADFFKRLAFQKPDSIILLGPNHFEKGNFKVLSSLYDWDTPFGKVKPDKMTLNRLQELNLVKIDEDVLPQDQALSALMPFIKYFLPDAKVVPLLMSSRLNIKDAEILANQLGNSGKKDTVIISSVDFSHYLKSTQAKEKDKITLGAIEEFNFQKLYLLNSDYLDSPPSITVLLKTMQNLGTTGMDLLYHTNSGQLQKKENIPVISYYSLVYH
ncbi:MAG: hypothetical protein UT54_C0003G0002 [Candidatus Daviesbacteria bacterium GW2011_GWB1_39_5]|uniref:AmmeMemoRadiSam system protein B n=1 Tax=Candidatus Daviesbacteria bacterium GW2011_GWC2_40_12 TaxID=1618431 RepID=A0A0G0T6W4_9BACT|nr:MAG: hypothetical protein UT45_C0001G0152 [Candidatus Daviesbacteria bacterium GW2011_GWA2_39_33]KKR25384.1 MAG: hypothetical protein UT54_C0003G0002 [Candidatus Daviesbacteria bacterium GW2011_GWB1_39_5]KKR42855.1 MAG: hypothetical protein UT77_C0001G0306 [Candidatus Daviesbacteria bacterium GW2011_GWC2_40_12]OGE21568.1 MAG: AmmeMemoRadiSam system protein B [Candidatus Daviesbacteria bacterium RIFCSPHIGHO2_01_FULL_40_24]OGE29061.1 MAG: AmmeMemoRadiSam system protein B [Candidatus Daviesbact